MNASAYYNSKYPKPKSSTLKLAAMTKSPNEHEAQRARELLSKIKPVDEYDDEFEYTHIVNDFLRSIGEETTSGRKLWSVPKKRA